MSDQDRGLSIRELVLEIRDDIKLIRREMGLFPTRKEVYGVLATIITIGLTVWGILAI